MAAKTLFAGEELDNVPEEQQVWQPIWAITLEQFKQNSTAEFHSSWKTGKYIIRKRERKRAF